MEINFKIVDCTFRLDCNFSEILSDVTKQDYRTQLM